MGVVKGSDLTHCHKNVVKMLDNLLKTEDDAITQNQKYVCYILRLLFV